MSIQEHLNKIRNAIYGREVRESIAKGIETAYDDASEKDNANMEVKIARGTHPNLRSRLEAEQSELETERKRINNLVANAGDTDGNAELLDIRVGADGTVHETAGEAVRNVLTPFTTENNEEWVV